MNVAAAPRRASTFRVVVRHQLRDHLRSRRLQWAIALTVFLAIVTTFARAADYADADATRSESSQGWLSLVGEQLQRDENVQLENTRSMSPLTLISNGLESVTPVKFSSTKEGIRFGEGRGSSSIVDTLFGYLDLSFVVGTIGSLLTLTLAFDTICGERKDGTLALVLSYTGDRRTFFLAKVTAVGLAGSICVVSGTLAAVAVHLSLRMPTGTAIEWFQFISVSIVYVFSFATLGTVVSACVSEPAGALVVCVGLWVSLVYVAPRIVAAAVNAIVPPRRAAMVAIETEAAISKLKVAKARADQATYEKFLANDTPQEAENAELRSAVAASSRQLDLQRRQLTNRLVERELQEDELRDRWIGAMSMALPPVLFYEASSEIARTGRTQRSRFYRDARIYDDQIGRRLVESRHVMHGGRDGVRGAVILVDDVRPYIVPFETRWVPAAQVWNAWFRAVVALLSGGLVLTLMGVRRMRSLDVRP